MRNLKIKTINTANVNFITKNIKITKGFTLLELVLSIALISLLVGVVSIFFVTMTRAQTKNQTILEVEEQGIAAMQMITQTIRNAASINTPASGLSAASLSLAVSDTAKNPTIFDISETTLRIKEGSTSPIPLINSRIVISELTFQNLSAPGTSGTVRATFTLSYVNPNNTSEYDYSKTFIGSASLK